jgi:hypothetical protein
MRCSTAVIVLKPGNERSATQAVLHGRTWVRIADRERKSLAVGDCAHRRRRKWINPV